MKIKLQYEYEYKYNYSETQIHNSTVKSNGAGSALRTLPCGLKLLYRWQWLVDESILSFLFLFFAAALSFVEESSFVFLYLFVFGAALSLAIMDRGGRQDGRNRREILLPQRGWRRGRN